MSEALSTLTPAGLSAVRAPRLSVLANGTPLAGGVSAEIVTNNHYAADTFSATLALGGDPAFPLAWWADQTTVALEIDFAFAPLGQDGPPFWQQMITGTVDHIELDPVQNVVHVSGRDLTSLLIDAPTQETFSNQTSSEIAITLAGRHGLTANVAPTSTMVGQYYQLEHDRITAGNFSRATTEWNLLVYLARIEGFDVWVSGNTLNFQPAQQNNAAPYVVQYVAPGQGVYVPTLTVTNLTMERSLTLAKDIQVTVKSWDSRNNVAHPVVYRSHGGASSKEPVQNYVYIKPGLTPDAALKFAQQTAAELARHERVISIDMPGELTLTPRTMLQLAGTYSSFDQTYFVDEITRSMDFSGGFTQRVRAKNSSPRTQTTVE